MPDPRQFVHTEWFDHALQKLGHLPRIENLLAEEFYRLANYADLVPLAPGCPQLGLYQTRPLLRQDGQVIRILIYFVVRPDGSVELQHIEPIEEDMSAGQF